jgi:hypothetical protein
MQLVMQVQVQAAKSADEAAEAEAGQQEEATLRAASVLAQEETLAAATAIARLGEDLRHSEVSCEALLQYSSGPKGAWFNTCHRHPV